MASKKDLKPLIKRAQAQGWTVTQTRGGHLCWKSGGTGQPYFSSSTPSDAKAVRNISADLRRRGLALP